MYCTRVILSLLIILVCIMQISCAGGGNVSDYFPPDSRVESVQETNELNSRLIEQSSGAPVSPADYLIGPADLLEVKVFESEKLTSTVRVSSRGEITLPLLGSVNVNGITAREAEEKLESLLKGDGYINNPHVSVFVKELKSKLVSVVGFVREPGSYELLGRQTVLDSLAAAKGLEDNAGRTVYLTRTEENGGRETFVIDLDQLLRKGNTESNIVLKPGDVVYVPEAGTVFVQGAVRKPGSYSMKERSTTVTQSIAMAGGITTYANGSDVKLVSHTENGKSEIVDLDLEKIKAGEAEDPVVRDSDVIIVGASGFKRLVYGLRVNFLLGLIGVGYDPPERYHQQ